MGPPCRKKQRAEQGTRRTQSAIVVENAGTNCTGVQLCREKEMRWRVRAEQLEAQREMISLLGSIANKLDALIETLLFKGRQP
jgi:hypothetical protein